QLPAARRGPGPIGNGRAGQVDHRVQRLVIQLLQFGDTLNAGPAERRHSIGATTPDPQLIPLGMPAVTEMATDQAGATGKQDAHEVTSRCEGPTRMPIPQPHQVRYEKCLRSTLLR